MPGSVLAVSCRALISYARARFEGTDDWLHGAGLTSAMLEDPEARLEPGAIFALWRQAYAALGDPALALHVAESLPRGAYRAVEYVAAHAPTVGQAYEKVADYFSVIDSTTELTIEADSTQVRFGPRGAGSDPSAYPAIEYMLAACYLRVRDMCGTPHHPVFLELATAPQAHTLEIERAFGCPVRSNAPSYRLVFARTDWDKPTAGADPALLAVLEDHARLLRERQPSTPSFLEALDRLLEQASSDGEPGLEGTARKLGMSARTLQRRLSDEGTAFADRVDAARRRATLRWLEAPDVSLADVAYLVGFKEQASLTRAVRRWTGQTPVQWRRGRQSG
jgi:AraC-like DNA-binding protein